MNPFQWISLVCLGGLLGYELRLFLGSRARIRAIAMRSLVWITALVAILYPRLASDVANLVGIARGSNLVLYTLCLAFLMTTFFAYSRYVQLRGEITQLVRHLAIREAIQGQPKSDDGDQSVR
jgi:hypothetical protein